MADYLLQEDDYRKSIDWSVWKRILLHARPYRKQLLGLSGSGIAVAGIESLLPGVTAWMIDEATTNGATRTLVAYGALYGALILSFSFFIWFFIVMAGQTATGVGCDLRNAGFEKLQELSFSYFDTRPVGWLITRLTSDCSKISNLIPWCALDLVWGTCYLTFVTIMMFWFNATLALWVMLIVPPLAILTAYFQTHLLESSRLMRKTNSLMTANYNESLMGVRTTKTLGREPENLKEFQTLSTDMYSFSMRNAMMSAMYLPAVIAIGSVGVGLALWKGGVSSMEDTTGISFGILVAFMQWATQFYMPIQELARRFADLQSAQAAAERVQSLLDTEPEIKDSSEVLDAIAHHANQRGSSSSQHLSLDGGDDHIHTIEFRDVSFWYKEDEPVLQNFDLTIQAGQTIALVGATGGGKSTIVSLVARFYEPNRGDVLINGTDYRQRSLHWLQSNLGVVLQSPHLFSGTIQENIRYGRLDASDDEIEEAAKLVNAHEFILEHDDGYESEVGEGGSKLSTGQRQLISLARAVLANPQIFIMDEATSSVDTETEGLIQDAVDAVLRDRIAFVIAHRLSTIRSADQILVIEKGHIVEHGSHGDLIAKRGKYYGLYTKQFAREREEHMLEGDDEDEADN